jgi:FdhE protein
MSAGSTAAHGTARIRTPEEIALAAGSAVRFLRLPDRASVFAEREMRLRQLAALHPMRDFLLFMGELAGSQHERLQRPLELALPDAELLDWAARLGTAPLAATVWSRGAAWQDDLRAIVDALVPRLPSSPAQRIVAALRDADPAWLDQQADRLLYGVMLGLDLAAAPLLAAALQTHWTRLVLATQQAHGHARVAPFGRVDDASRCPCCASLPTASIVRIGGEASGHRYLHCSLCSAQWHVVRIKCTHCGKTQRMGYQSQRAASEEASSRDAPRRAVEVETCDECGHYLKIADMARDPFVEPVADDLATVTLDLLVAEAGYHRHGVNLLLCCGDEHDEGEA